MMPPSKKRPEKHRKALSFNNLKSNGDSKDPTPTITLIRTTLLSVFYFPNLKIHILGKIK